MRTKPVKQNTNLALSASWFFHWNCGQNEFWSVMPQIDILIQENMVLIYSHQQPSCIAATATIRAAHRNMESIQFQRHTQRIVLQGRWCHPDYLSRLQRNHEISCLETFRGAEKWRLRMNESLEILLTFETSNFSYFDPVLSPLPTSRAWSGSSARSQALAPAP